jgi:hypothetical protein
MQCCLSLPSGATCAPSAWSASPALLKVSSSTGTTKVDMDMEDAKGDEGHRREQLKQKSVR